MTKQYTLIYILLGVLMFAVSAFTAAALREANTTYDLSALKMAQEQLATQVAEQVAAQESAMAAWAAEATLEVETANTDVAELRRLTCESIVTAPVGGGTGSLGDVDVEICAPGTTATGPVACIIPPEIALGIMGQESDCQLNCQVQHNLPYIWRPIPPTFVSGLCCCPPA